MVEKLATIALAFFLCGFIKYFFFDTLFGQDCNHDRIYKKTYN